MPHRFQISRDSQALFITLNTKNRQKVNYIHNNPVQAGMVEQAIDYRWSSARIWQQRPLDDEPLLMDIDRIIWRKAKFGA